MKDWLKSKFSKVSSVTGNIIEKILEKNKLSNVSSVAGSVIETILGIVGSLIGLALIPVVLLAAFAMIIVMFALVVDAIPIFAIAALGAFVYSRVRDLYEDLVDRKDIKRTTQEFKDRVIRQLDYAIERAEGIDIALDQDGKSVIAENLIPICDEELLEYKNIINEKNKMKALQYSTDIAALNVLKEQLKFVKNKEEAEGLKRLITSFEFKIQDMIITYSDYTITDPESARDSLPKLYENREKVRELTFKEINRR